MTNAGTLFQNARSVLKWRFPLLICSFWDFCVIEFNCECVCVALGVSLLSAIGYWDALF